MCNGDARFESARRVVRILDLVGLRGVLSVKALARELGVSLCPRATGW